MPSSINCSNKIPPKKKKKNSNKIKNKKPLPPFFKDLMNYNGLGLKDYMSMSKDFDKQVICFSLLYSVQFWFLFSTCYF